MSMLEFPFGLFKTLKNSNQVVDWYTTNPEAQQFRCCMLCGCSLYMFVPSNTAKVFQNSVRTGSKEVNMTHGKPSSFISHFARFQNAYGFCPLEHEVPFLLLVFFFFSFSKYFLWLRRLIKEGGKEKCKY